MKKDYNQPHINSGHLVPPNKFAANYKTKDNKKK